MRTLSIALAFVVAACTGGAGTPPTEAPAAVETEAPAEAPYVGSGVVTFGLAYDPETLRIPKPIERFSSTLQRDIAWSAELVEPAGATTLRLMFARVGKGGSEEIVYSTDTEISNPEFSGLANTADLLTIAGRKAGTYVIRYLRDATVLAEGQFEVID